MYNVTIYYQNLFWMYFKQRCFVWLVESKNCPKGAAGLYVNSELSGCKLRLARGNRQGSHSLPYHAHFCSIIASCSQWWDRSSQSRSWSSPTADISRLSVDLSLSSAFFSIKKTRFGSFWKRLPHSCWDRLTAGHFSASVSRSEFIPCCTAGCTQ